MAPRCGKRRRRVRNAIPVWLPLPRPCLRSLNIPGPPYYMPISPEMYLPPWTLPPTYFTKPICHCANENFCTANNCKNSNECLKMQSMFCPHGNKHDETLHQINVREQSKDDQETSSNSDLNVCSACGAPSNILRRLDKKKNLGQDNQPRSNKSSHNLEQHNEGTRGISNTERNVTRQEKDITTDFDHTSPETAVSKNQSNDFVNKSCQTSLSNPRSRGKKSNNNLYSQRRKRMSSESTTDSVENSEYCNDSNVLPPSETYQLPINIIKDGTGCTKYTEEQNSPANDSETSNPISSVMHKESEGITKTLPSDKLHVNQLPDQLSNARKRQTNKYSGCCFTGSEKGCETATKTNKTDKQMVEIPFKNITKLHKMSECGCHSVNTSNRASSKHRKLADCLCTSSKIPNKETSRFRKISKCECYPNKMLHKHSSRSHKLSECGCSSAKINQKNSRKISDCSCPSTDLPHKASSKSQRVSESKFSSTEGSITNVRSPSQLAPAKSIKSSRDVTTASETNAKQSSCQCKFPPAYEHLSCTGNLTDNCSCTKNL